MDLVSMCNGIPYCAAHLSGIVSWVQIGLGILGSITLLATFLVRIPALAKYEGPVNTFRGKFLLASRWFPTIGINPQTKKIEEALETPPAPVAK